MIYRRFSINDWDIHFLAYVNGYDIRLITNILKELYAPDDIIARINDNCIKNELNTGFTYSNKSERKSIIVIGKTSNGSEFLNSYSHELRHLVDDIADSDNMEIAGEEVAYLTGDICNYLSDIVCLMSCECCRNKKSRGKLIPRD